MKSSKKLLKLVEKANSDVLCIGINIEPLGGNRIDIMDKESEITPGIQEFFSKVYLTTKLMNKEDKPTVFDILKKQVFTL